MSELLTEDQYGAIAAEMAFPTGAWINGKAQSAASGERFTSVNPANGEVVAEIACCGEPEVNLAVERRVRLLITVPGHGNTPPNARRH